MIVYLAEVSIPYEVGYTVGVFSTEEKALAALRKWHEADSLNCGDDVVSEWEVDKGA